MSLAKRRHDEFTAGGSGDKIKLGLMIGALVVILIVFATMTLKSGDPDDPDPRTVPGSSGAGGDTIQNETASVIEETTDGRITARVSSDSRPFDLRPEKAIDPAKLAQVRDDSDLAQGVFKEEPLDYLLNHVYNESSIRRKRGGFQIILPEALLAGPDQYRGRPVEIKGKLLPYETIPYEDHVKGATSITRGFIQLLPKGDDELSPDEVVSFTCVEEPSLDGGGRAQAGEIVRLQGFFLKTWRAVPPESDRPVSMPHIIALRFVESFRVVPQTEVDPLWFKVRDGNNLDEPPFWLILNYVSHLTPEGYEDLKTQGVLELVPLPPFGEPFAEGPAPVAEIMDFGAAGLHLDENCDRFRGRIVRVTGSLYKCDPVSPTDNEGGIERYYQGWLALESNYVIPFVAPLAPDGYGVEEGQLVHIEGYLYKRWVWDSAKGDRLRAPMLVVTNIIEVDMGGDPMVVVRWILAAVAVIFVIALGVMLFTDRRSSRQHEERRQKKREMRRARTGAEPEAEGDPESPPEDVVE
jgi:hypothetical protein